MPPRQQWCTEEQAMRPVRVIAKDGDEARRGQMVCQQCGDFIYCTECGQRWTDSHECGR